MTPLQAIKEFCFLCCGENSAEVTRCTAPNCPLYPFRKGHSSEGRKLTDEQKAQAAERLKKAREMKKAKESRL